MGKKLLITIISSMLIFNSCKTINRLIKKPDHGQNFYNGDYFKEADGNLLNSEYWYEGKIDNQKIKFYEEKRGNTNILQLILKGGDYIKFIDDNNDFKLDYLEIKIKEELTILSKNSDKEIIKRFQIKFDNYLMKIREIKIKKMSSPLNKGKLKIHKYYK